MLFLLLFSFLIQFFLSGLLGGENNLSFGVFVLLLAYRSGAVELFKFRQFLFFCRRDTRNFVSSCAVDSSKEIFRCFFLTLRRRFFTFGLRRQTFLVRFSLAVSLSFFGRVDASDVLLCFCVAGGVIRGDLFFGDSFTFSERLFIHLSLRPDALTVA